MIFDSFWHGTLKRPYRLYTTSHGNPEKPVIVLIHGIAASGEFWGRLIPLLEVDYRCITIDLLGFGKSPKPKWATYDIDQHIRSIRRAIRAQHIDGEFTLVGHSLGSLLAANYVSRYPEHVERLFLLSPPVYPPTDTIQGKMALRRTDLLMRVYRYLRSSPRLTPANIVRLSKFGVLPTSIAKHPETWIPFQRSLEHCIEQQTILRDIKNISIPIDVFYGTRDSVVVGEHVRRLSDTPNVQVHSFRGNHKLGQKYAAVVAKLLLTVDA